MRIRWCSVDRSLTLGELEKGPELGRAKNKGTSRHLWCEIQSQLMWYKALEKILQQ